MSSLYNILALTAEKVLPLSGLFSEKMKLFVEGRKNVFQTLKKNISPKDKTIWFHAASLGEYEQAVPVIKEMKTLFPTHKIIITFFSPSGYEIRKNSALAEVVTYLPLDTKKNARRFLDLAHPDWALFIKYEFWPNILKEIKNREIKSLLVSGVFHEKQIFFKTYGGWMREYLHTFKHFFVQNQRSKQLLNSVGFTNVTISGDTRFDRVTQQLSQDNDLPFIEEFKNAKPCIVIGSSWPEDEDLVIDFINQAGKDIKFIIAPHTIKKGRINGLRARLSTRTILFSEKEAKPLAPYQVFIIDTIGLLTKIYSYADIAYVGGAAGNTGLHNILEPATFGVPIVIGKNFSRFPEAQQLKKEKGLYSVRNPEELSSLLSKLLEDQRFRKETGVNAANFISRNTGATKKILDFVKKYQSGL